MPTTVFGRTAFDLTQPISPRTPRSSDHPQIRFDSLRWRSRHGQKTSTVTMSVHMGTHIDSPSLYYHDGATIDQIGPEITCGSAVVFSGERDDWGEITAADLDRSPEPIRPGDILIIRTGWHRHYADEERYILKGPGLTKDAFDWVVDHRVKMIASDSPSPEHFFSRWKRWLEMRPDVVKDLTVDPARFPPSYGHKTLLKLGIPLLESLGGEIDLLPPRVDLVALPLKYEDVEAAQARAIAFLP